MFMPRLATVYPGQRFVSAGAPALPWSRARPPLVRAQSGIPPAPVPPSKPYLYSTPGSHNPIAGNVYSSTSARTWIAMNGSMPRKIWFSVTCGGDTPFR